MTSKTIIRNLKRLEKVMVWMLDLPVEENQKRAISMAKDGQTVVCFDVLSTINPNSPIAGFCGCVAGFYRKKTGRSAFFGSSSDFKSLPLPSRIFGSYRGKGDTVRSRLAIVRKLIKKYERDQ